MAHIVFVHGMYMTSSSWDAWRAWFEDRGYSTDAVDWPGREGTPSALRRDPPDLLASLTLDDVVDRVREHVEQQPEPPVLIGHSMGGLVVQRLLAEGLGRAGAALASAPPNGLTVFSWSFLRANRALLWPGSSPIEMDFPSFRYAWAHTEDEATARRLYNAHVVPESRLVGKGATTDAARLDPAARTAPLLLVAAEQDRTIPATLIAKNHTLYADNPARTDVVTLPGRTHLIALQDGWEEAATRVATWLDDALPAARPALASD